MKDINWRRYKFQLLLLLLAGGGGALLRFGGRWGHAAEGIGEALIIAGILGLTVDGYIKEHLLEEASRDIAKYVWGYRLPTEVRKRFEDLMLTKRVTRGFHLHYELSPINATPGKVLVETTLTYQTQNIGNEVLPYRRRFYQQKYFSPCFLELRCISSDTNGNYYIGPKELSEQLKSQEGSSEIGVATREIKLLPYDSLSNPQYEFKARWTLVCPDDYSDFFVLDESPTIGVLITAEYPDEFEFEGPSPATQVKGWNYPRVFFANEQITVHWRKKRN
ncbi:MAG TPA: hypothetical protein DC054_00810 [Blastocatellia bacterium]|nr:hypothetical protein [Blastocatellia bacterium]